MSHCGYSHQCCGVRLVLILSPLFKDDNSNTSHMPYDGMWLIIVALRVWALAYWAYGKPAGTVSKSYASSCELILIVSVTSRL
jgi:hypothetical protein